MKRALIHLGAGPLQSATLAAARDAGFHVVATDLRAEAPLAHLADEFHVISGSDAEGLLQLAREVNGRHPVAGAYASSDFGLVPVARIHREWGLPGCTLEAVDLALDKHRAKAAFAAAGVPTPRGWIVGRQDGAASVIEAAASATGPLVVKPVASSGSQGVSSVSDPRDLPAALEQAFIHGDQAVVEEYFTGTGVDTIGIVHAGRFLPCGIGTRVFSEGPFHFPLHGHTPPDLSAADAQRAYDLTARAALALGIDDSPVKADLLFNGRDFTLLEVTPRFHGDVFSAKLVPFACGQTPARLLFDLMAGREAWPFPAAGKGVVLWHALFPLNADLDFADVRSRLAARWRLLDFQFDAARLRRVGGHRDNTSLTGFFWVRLDGPGELAWFHEFFAREFGGDLL